MMRDTLRVSRCRELESRRKKGRGGIEGYESCILGAVVVLSCVLCAVCLQSIRMLARERNTVKGEDRYW